MENLKKIGVGLLGLAAIGLVLFAWCYGLSELSHWLFGRRLYGFIFSLAAPFLIFLAHDLGGDILD